MDALKLMSEGSLKETPPEFSIGDTVRVDVKIREGERERIQAYEGTVIAKKGSGVAVAAAVPRNRISMKQFPPLFPVFYHISTDFFRHPLKLTFLSATIRNNHQ